MTHATYLRYEVLRTFRNRRFLIFSLAFPLVLLLTIGSANRHATVDGISFPLYFMAGMVSWGAMVAMISSGARIAAERQVGWTRQLRITPLRAGAYFRARILCGYVMVLITLVVLYLAGSWLGVRLDVKEWVTMTVLILVGLVPFAVIGIMFGHLLKPDSLGPAVGGLTALFALFGGAWPHLDRTRLRRRRKVHPFLLARASGQVRSRPLRLAARAGLDRGCGLDRCCRLARRPCLPARHCQGMSGRPSVDLW